MTYESRWKLYVVLTLFFPLFCPRLAIGAGCDGGGNCYVRAGTTGNGSSWANACGGFTGSCDTSSTKARGVTYWVGGGTYICNFSAPDSASSVITVKGATTTSHGPDATWNNSYAGQAVFHGDCLISTDYWTFDGQTRGADWQSGYTLKFWNNGDDNSGYAVGTSGSSGTYHDWSFKYVEIQGTTSRGDAYTDEGFQCLPTCNNIYVGFSYIHEAAVDLVSMNWGDGNGSGHTFENDYFYRNDYARSNGCGGRCHAQAMQETGSNLVVRYSIFQDIMNSGVITDASGGTPTFSNREFYGNIIFWDSSYNSDPDVFLGGRGVLGFFGEHFSGHIYFYNNTIVGVGVNNQAQTCIGDSYGFVSGGGGITTAVEDNLWEHTPNCNPGDNGAGVDYNAYGSGSGNNRSFGAHDYTTGTELLSNWTAYTISGFKLAADMAGHTGITLGPPFNMDPDGNIRGTDGTWDRGAYEYNARTSVPNPPTNLKVTTK